MQTTETTEHNHPRTHHPHKPAPMEHHHLQAQHYNVICFKCDAQIKSYKVCIENLFTEVCAYIYT